MEEGVGERENVLFAGLISKSAQWIGLDSQKHGNPSNSATSLKYLAVIHFSQDRLTRN